MTDEKFLFLTDCSEKKRIGWGAANKRTHTGKGGAVKFPSDGLSRKELAAMSGECKSYKLNEPMTWAEFKQMPNDIRAMYITSLRNKYNIEDKDIAKMMGCKPKAFSMMMQSIGCAKGKAHKRSGRIDYDGWDKWLHGIKDDSPAEPQETEDKPVEVVEAAEAAPCYEPIAEYGEVERKLEGEIMMEIGKAKAEIAYLNDRIAELAKQNECYEIMRRTIEVIFGREFNFERVHRS